MPFYAVATFHKGSIVLGVAVILLATRCFAATPAEIQIAIEKGRDFLYSKQHPGGQWELEEKRRGAEHDVGGMQGDTFGGYTAIATYALLASGESRTDPRMAKAIQFLEDADVIGIYSLGLRANVWALLPGDRKAKAMAEHDAQLLIAGMHTGKEVPEHKGFWDYGNGHGPQLRASFRIDHSVSQYGVLGLWACAQQDIPIDRKVWETIDAAWKSHQFPSGSWDYNHWPSGTDDGTVNMTAAGVATLFITEDILFGNRGLDCSGNQFNDNIERGLTWITKHFSEVDNGYAWYGIERIGAASGRKYFGSIDWYAIGAEKLVHSQKPDGSWDGNYVGASSVPSTAFGILFLARGREPVMMNKLQYDLTAADTGQAVPGHWSQRNRDVSNLVHWTGHQLERPLSWQIVGLKDAVDDLHNAPILYISGDQELKFPPEDEAKLREFVESGGMIVGNADCGAGKTAFATSLEALGKRLFPKYDFRDLPASHLIFTDQPYHATKWKTLPRVRGMSNGVREMILTIPDSDPARSWQLHTADSELANFQFGADIFLYAVDKQNLKYKGENYYIRPDPNIIADRTIRVARLDIGKNNDPEPGGWRRIAGIVHNQFQLDVDTKIVKLPEQKLTGFKIAHLTGTEKFVLDPASRAALVDFVKHGGTLVIDAAGGNSEFAEAAIQELKLCFGSDAMEGLAAPLDLSNPLYRVRGATIRQISYRDIYRRQNVGKLRGPRLYGIKVAGRMAVYYSREDLTAGMVGEPVGGIAGYSPQTATEIMRNIVLYNGFALPAAN